MDSRIDNLELYNREFKLKFLDTFDEDSQLTYAYILSKAVTTEEYLKRDLYTFDDQEIALVLHGISPVNLSSSTRYGGIIRNYIDFAITNGRRKGNINPLTALPKEWYKQFVGNKKIHISLDELEQIEKELVNKQDILPLYLAFEGIVGENLEEQTTLTLDSIIDENTLSVHEIDKEPREVKVSNKCIQLIREAAAETEYEFKNGESMGKRTVGQLPNNKYVLRNPIRGESSDPDAPISKFVLFRRLRMVKDLFNLPNITFNTLKQSGMIKAAVDIFHEKGKLERDDLEYIREKVGVNYLFAVNSIVKREKVLELYGVDIEATNK